MTNDKREDDALRKFLYFFDNKIAVHFKDLDNIFYNGYVVDLDKEKNVMVFSERVKGTMPILLEFINPDSIRKFEEDVRDKGVGEE